MTKKTAKIRKELLKILPKGDWKVLKQSYSDAYDIYLNGVWLTHHLFKMYSLEDTINYIKTLLIISDFIRIKCQIKKK